MAEASPNGLSRDVNELKEKKKTEKKKTAAANKRMKRWNVGPSGQTYGDVPRSLAAIHLREKNIFNKKKKLSFRWRVSSVTLINEPIRCDVGTTKKKKKKTRLKPLGLIFCSFLPFAFGFEIKKNTRVLAFEGGRLETRRHFGHLWPKKKQNQKQKTKPPLWQRPLWDQVALATVAY